MMLGLFFSAKKIIFPPGKDRYYTKLMGNVAYGSHKSSPDNPGGTINSSGYISANFNEY